MKERLIIYNILKKLFQSSHVQLFCDPMDCTGQASLSMGFPRPEYRSGLPFPSPGELPNPGIEPRSPILQADTLLSEPPWRQSKGISRVDYLFEDSTPPLKPIPSLVTPKSNSYFNFFFFSYKACNNAPQFLLRT